MLKLILAALYMPVAPAPKEMSADWSVRVPLEGRVEVRCAESPEAAGRWISGKFAGWFGKAPQVVSAADSSVTEPEGYEIAADGGGVRLSAKTLQGIRYAAYTVRQLAIPRRGTLTTEGFILPRLQVKDAPSIARRMLHLCWMPEYGKAEMERRIRLAATLKFNIVILESWGTFRSAKHPWWGWADGEMTPAELKRLVALAKDLGVTLVPQLNVYGHATMCRSISGKHATLDLDPTHAPLFEPRGGWNWCLTNPETKRVQKELIREEWEAFGRPPFVHIGCDEAHGPSCPDCLSRPYAEIVGEHIAEMCAFVKSLGARPMLWQDMFLERGDPRWKGYYTNGNKETAAILGKLPKDAIICDWFYTKPPSETADYPTLDHFVSLGFDTVTCPCYNAKGCALQGRLAQKKNLFGYMGTTWNYCFGGLYADVFTYNAFAAWGSEVGDYEQDSKIAFMQLLRDVTREVPELRSRTDGGVFTEQVPSAHAADFGWRGSAYRNWADAE